MTKFETLKATHQDLLAQHDAGDDTDALAAAAQSYIERVRVDSEDIADPRDRDQLRAYLRFWAAFLYDQSGTYPETSLRPAAELDRWARIPSDWRWIAAGMVLIFVILVILANLGPVIGATFDWTDTPTAVSSAPEEDTPQPPTETTDMDQVSSSDRTNTPRPPTKTATPTATPSLTVTPFEAEATPDTVTATEAIVDTVTATPKLNQQPESLAGPLGEYFSIQGGKLAISEKGEQIFSYRDQLMTTYGGDAARDAGCTARYVDVSLKRSGSTFEQNAAVPIWVNRAGETQIAFEAELLAGQPRVTLDLGQLSSSEEVSYLLHIEHPRYMTSDVVFQLSQGCRSQRLVLEYQHVSDWSYLETEPDRDPDLSLAWRLVTWGPEPFDAWQTARWFAVLDLVGQGGDGRYIFWQADEIGLLVPLDDARVIVRGYACWPSRVLVGLTSAGEAVTREILLQVPYCPEGAPAP